MENQPIPEDIKMLDNAVYEVVGLYLGDLLAATLPTQDEKQRDQAWSSIAQQFPAFSEKIYELRARMREVDDTVKAYSEQLRDVYRIPFMQVKDKYAQHILGNVSLSRRISSPGTIDTGINPSKEATWMSKEMGLPQGWHSDQAKNVTLNDAVRFVLQGTLRVAYQPKQGG